MGFPRIISKNNRIYTKLGDFCLTADGAQFWIICHTCQEELQTQDQFWKHIQDEHNFLQIRKESTRTNSYVESDAGTALMPLPLYRKVNEEEQRAEEHDDSSQEKEEAKDYTEMRVIEPKPLEIDIKVEPSNVNQQLPPPTAAHQHQQHQQQQIESSIINTLYQLPQGPPVSAYTAIIQAPSINATVPVVPAAPQATVSLMSHEIPKESNSTTASASSAVSSDDGERWYICDFESCGLKFKYQSRLELHRSVHSKERRFACELCGASFKQSCNLSTHRKKKHFLKGIKGMVQQRY